MLCALGTIVAGAAFGQGAPQADPKDPAAAVPRLVYRSAFEGYKRFAEEEIGGWREANDEVRAAGGHLGHRPSKPQPGTPESAGRPAPRDGGHEGHHK